MSDSNGTRRIFQQIPMDSIGFQRIPMDFTGKNMKKSENVGKRRKFMIRLFMIRLGFDLKNVKTRQIFVFFFSVAHRINFFLTAISGSHPIGSGDSDEAF